MTAELGMSPPTGTSSVIMEATGASTAVKRSLELDLRRLLGDEVAVDGVGGVDVGVAEPLGELADGPSRLQREGREGVPQRMDAVPMVSAHHMFRR